MSIQGTIKEKGKENEELQKKAKTLESEMTQLKLDKAQEINKTKEEMTLEMERKVAQIENDNFDQMNKKDLELKDLQERVYKANENLDKARV